MKDFEPFHELDIVARRRATSRDNVQIWENFENLQMGSKNALYVLAKLDILFGTSLGVSRRVPKILGQNQSW